MYWRLIKVSYDLFSKQCIIKVQLWLLWRNSIEIPIKDPSPMIYCRPITIICRDSLNTLIVRYHLSLPFVWSKDRTEKKRNSERKKKYSRLLRCKVSPRIKRILEKRKLVLIRFELTKKIYKNWFEEKKNNLFFCHKFYLSSFFQVKYFRPCKLTGLRLQWLLWLFWTVLLARPTIGQCDTLPPF